VPPRSMPIRYWDMNYTLLAGGAVWLAEQVGTARYDEKVARMAGFGPGSRHVTCMPDEAPGSCRAWFAIGGATFRT